MPPIEPMKISDALNEMKMVLSEMRTLHETGIERQKIWEQLITEMTNNNKERLNLIDKRWNCLRQIVIVFIGTFLTAALGGGFVIDKRVSDIELEDRVKEFAREDDVSRAINVVIEDSYDVYEREEILTHDEAREGEGDIKRKVNREFGDNYRTAKEIKDGN